MLGDGNERHARIVQRLVDAHADINLVADSNEQTPLRSARRRGYAEIERMLMVATR
ncbi:hypothetical protein ACVBGC_26875 [Burkholderia stagnalis]